MGVLFRHFKGTIISFTYCSFNTFKFKEFHNSKNQKGWWWGRVVVQTENSQLSLNLQPREMKHFADIYIDIFPIASKIFDSW